MRRLIIDGAAALRAVEFFRPARSVQIVSVVDGVDHAHGAIGAALHQRSQPLHRRIERMRMTDDEMNFRSARRRDNRRAIRERQRQGLFDQQVFAVAGREQRMLRMKLMWRCNIDRVDSGIGAEFLGRGVGFAAKIRDKALPRRLPRVGGGHHGHATVAGKRRQHQAEGPAETDNAQFDGAIAAVVQRPPASTRLPLWYYLRYLRIDARAKFAPGSKETPP